MIVIIEINSYELYSNTYRNRKESSRIYSFDPDEWIKSAATNRANKAIKEIIEKNTTYCNEKSIAIAVGEDAQVTQAYTLGVIQTAKAVQDASKSSE